MSKIKPCPFCRGACITRDAIPNWPNVKVSFLHIWCMNCDYQSPPYREDNLAELIAAHNQVFDTVKNQRRLTATLDGQH